uniref:Aprataxin n=1 Tax=Kwoniella pini CBS 10737 TaxID=1296096 RepID=A0A1B9IEG4_9TREE|nr:aprataxin [Kwoniella pini CBS 10737]OCF53670.1 aprataxin [Kwoniella pini CBS 10737]
MGNCFAPISSNSSSTETSPRDTAPNPSTTQIGEPNEEQRLQPTSIGSNREISSSGPSRRQSTTLGRLNKHKRTSSLFSMVGPSLDALRNYATLPNPQNSLSASTLLLSSKTCLAVFDAYPKAKYHFLVLPRYPFPPQSDPESKESITSLNSLNDLKSILLKTTPSAREEILQNMNNMANEVEEMIRDEMLKSEGFEWKVDIGFHAIPSMKRVNNHDRISPSLKTKKHHNSFRPDLGFFIPIMEVQRWIEDDSNMQERVDALSGAEQLLNTPLTCHKCDEFISNIPKLKTHLEKHFQDERSSALKHIARHGRQRSSDEEIF